MPRWSKSDFFFKFRAASVTLVDSCHWCHRPPFQILGNQFFIRWPSRQGYFKIWWFYISYNFLVEIFSTSEQIGPNENLSFLENVFFLPLAGFFFILAAHIGVNIENCPTRWRWNFKCEVCVELLWDKPTSNKGSLQNICIVLADTRYKSDNRQMVIHKNT